MKKLHFTRMCAAIAACGLAAVAAFGTPPDAIVNQSDHAITAVQHEHGATFTAADVISKGTEGVALESKVAYAPDLDTSPVDAAFTLDNTAAFGVKNTTAVAGFAAIQGADAFDSSPHLAVANFASISGFAYAPDLDTSPNLAIAGLGQFNGVIVDSSPHVAGTALIEPDTSPTVAVTLTVAELDTSAAIGLQLKENGFEVAPASGA